ncbi:MAG: ABC transporter permease subunit [Armatimonadota bacterium]
MLAELAIEYRKLLMKSRTYIGPAAMLFIITAMLVGLKYSHQFDRMESSMAQDFIIAGTITNAAFLARYLLQGIFFFFLPLAVCSICGDLVASKAADGTLRMILCRPISRLSILTTKYVACITSSVGLTLGTGLVAYLAGYIFLGGGSLFVMPSFGGEGGIRILPEHDALIRLIAAYSLTAAGMLAVGSIAFMISTFLSNSNGAIFGAMGFLIASGILGQIDYFRSMKPYLITTYLDKWEQFFGETMDVQVLYKSIGVMLIYSAACFVIGAVIFKRRDVLV